MENVAQMVAPVQCESLFAKAGHLVAAYVNFTAVRLVYASDYIQKGAFAGAGRPKQNAKFPLFD